MAVKALNVTLTESSPNPAVLDRLGTGIWTIYVIPLGHCPGTFHTALMLLVAISTLSTDVHTADNQAEGYNALDMHIDFKQSITDNQVSLRSDLYSPEKL